VLEVNVSGTKRFLRPHIVVCVSAGGPIVCVCVGGLRSSSSSSTLTFLEAPLHAVRDGHPPLRDEVVEDARGHGRVQAVQSLLPRLRTASGRGRRERRRSC